MRIRRIEILSAALGRILTRRPWLPLLVLLLGTPATQAQRPDRPATSQRSDDQRDAFRERMRQRREAREASPRSRRERTRAPLERVLGGSPFQPQPEDFAPLQPGEERQLRRFMHDHMPAEMQKRISFLLRRSPEAFENRVVPRLRQLRRVFDTDPQLGELLARHMANGQRINLLGVQWQRNPKDRERLRETLRTLVAENYRIESEVLAERLATMRRDRGQRIADLVDLYQDPEANLSAEPEAVRTTIDRIHAAPDDKARQRLRDRLHELAEKRIDREIAQAEKSLRKRNDEEPRAIEREWQRQIHAMPRP